MKGRAFMDRKREIKIKERIQERYDILEALYSSWFTEKPVLEFPKENFYQQGHIEKHRAITYLVDKGYIVANSAENDPETVEVSITSDGIDFYEQGLLNGTGEGWSIVTEHIENK
ncbi:hypothetical protein KQI74_15480 [Paenibacillus barcinonensis]|jgi:hypothetical protein|uniref:hypothetical protein n=2 Tax=Paenibacillus TaxID=44249 RepID=UPI001C10EC6E|nr:hypothetical protein [Paenibacillus barcinonensis]MBU5353694.1 hypothetical protein [Paenibacillus barcinonensis]MDM5279336.1 hypothetical protein [Paenibacillus silvae]